MAVHGFGGTDPKIICVRLEDLANGARFRQVIELGACTVRINVGHRIDRNARLVQGEAHGARRAFNARLRHMDSVGACAISDDLGKNRRATANRVIIVFKQQYRGTFANDHALAVDTERTARLRRTFTGRRQHPHRFPALDDAVSDRRVRSPGKHDVGCAASDGTERFADGMGRRSAGGGNR